jgi:hypothetical protein
MVPHRGATLIAGLLFLTACGDSAGPPAVLPPDRPPTDAGADVDAGAEVSDASADETYEAETAADAPVDTAPEGMDGDAELPARHMLWAKAFGTVRSDVALGVAIAGDGALGMTGFFSGKRSRPDALDDGGDIFVSFGKDLDHKQWSFGKGQGGTGRALGFDKLGNFCLAGTLRGTVDFGTGSLTTEGSADGFIAKIDRNGKAVWAKKLGAAGEDHVLALTVDGTSGDIFVAGAFSGTVDFGGTSLTSAGSTDVFVARYTTNGALVWAKRAGGPEADLARSIAIDGKGNVLIAGTFRGTGDFGSASLTSAGADDPFVAKFDATGAAAWARRFGGSGSDLAFGVAGDAQGNVAVTGGFEGTVDFGAGALTSAGMRDVFVVTLTPAGALSWARRTGGPSDDAGYGVRFCITNGTVCVGGTFSDKLDLPGMAVTSAGSSDAFVAAFRADGTPIWGKAQGGAGTDDARAMTQSSYVVIAGSFSEWMVDRFIGNTATTHNESDAYAAFFDVAGTPKGLDNIWDNTYATAVTLAVSPDGQVSFTAQFDDDVDFGGGPIGPLSDANVAIVDLGPDGAYRAAKLQNSPPGFYVDDMAYDPAGSLILTGGFDGSIDLGGIPLASAGMTDMYVAKRTAGRIEWARRFGGAKTDYSNRVAVDADGNIVVIGVIQGAADFVDGPAPAGMEDGFVLKLSPTGSTLWSKRFSSPSGTGVGRVVIGADGSIVVSASFKTQVDVAGTVLSASGTNEGFLAKFNAVGALQWAKKFGDGPGINFYGLAVDRQGAIAVATSFNTSISIGGKRIDAYREDGLVAKLSADGSLLWTKAISGSEDEYAVDVAFSPEGDIILVGSFSSSLDLGTGAMKSAGSRNTFVAELQEGGTCTWSTHFGGRYSDFPTRLWVDQRSNVYLAGSLGDRADFGAGFVGVTFAESAMVLALGR